MPEERIRYASQAMQLFVGQRPERGHVLECGIRDRSHRVQPEQLQPADTQMNAGNHVVLEPTRSEGATVAHTVPQDAPGISPAASVFPEHAQHFQVVSRLVPHQEPERHEERDPPPELYEERHAREV